MSNSKHFERESDFHDEWASETAIEDVKVEAAFTSVTALENGYIVKVLGELRNCRLLDIGCGLGESSVMFAKLGAEVTASDLSPGMLDFTEKLAEFHGVKITPCIGPGESLELPDASFDVIYTANTIHHLANKEAFFKEVRRLLKPDGVFCSWDPVKYNPLINVYRIIASEVRSKDETPLGLSDLKMIKRHFASVETRYFWLTTLSLFVKYFLFNRVNPNKERYWKRIYRENDRSLFWWKPLSVVDNLLLRLPILKWFSWNMVVIARQPQEKDEDK